MKTLLCLITILLTFNSIAQKTQSIIIEIAGSEFTYNTPCVIANNTKQTVLVTAIRKNKLFLVLAEGDEYFIVLDGRYYFSITMTNADCITNKSLLVENVKYHDISDGALLLGGLSPHRGEIYSIIDCWKYNNNP